MTKTITIELSEKHYTRFEYLANDLGKSVEEYAKQTIENKADAFYQRVKEMNENKKK